MREPDGGNVGAGGAAIGEGGGEVVGHEQGLGPILPMSQFAMAGAQPPTPPPCRGSGISARGPGVSASFQTNTLKPPPFVSNSGKRSNFMLY